jgi:hypothetical protein
LKWDLYERKRGRPGVDASKLFDPEGYVEDGTAPGKLELPAISVSEYSMAVCGTGRCRAAKAGVTEPTSESLLP